MPTGYTYNVMDGTISTFPDFAMQCARAFGACITMRDDPMDAPIPEEFKPGTYNADGLAKAQERLRELRAMSPAQVDQAAAADFTEKLARAERCDAENEEQDRRLDAMIKKVNAWTPPTAEHVQMKAFMLEQLRISKHGDYRVSRPKAMNGQEWLEVQVNQAIRVIEYHAGEYAKEVERAKGRTEWLRALRQSLKQETL